MLDKEYKERYFASKTKHYYLDCFVVGYSNYRSIWYSVLGDQTVKRKNRLIISPFMARGLIDNIKRIKMTQEAILNTLQSIRAPILDYQEARGVSRSEKITFISLITSLCTHAYTAAITILVMLWNLAPLLDGFVYFARFSLDKLIDILQTQDIKEKALKAAVFTGEIIVIFFIIFLIVGLIFMPVFVLSTRIINKIWGMIAW